MAALVQLENVSKRYETPAGAEGPWILKDLCLEVAAGESLAVVGPSGCGKSTLLNIIGGLDRPTGGSARLDGRELTDLGEAELAEVRNRQLGFVFQLHHLLAQCTALENVLLPALPAAGADEQAVARARELLQRVGLGERLSYRPAELSGGERQRVAVVRALINAPKLLLADEPTGSLDRESAEKLARLLAELNAHDQVTLIVVTHSAELARHMGRKLELRGGALLESSP